MPTYRERLWVPPSWAAVGVALALLVAVSFRRDVLLLLGLPALALVLTGWLSRHVVRVAGGVLHVPGARAPVTAFGAAEVLDRSALRERLGVRAHRDAWVAVRPWARAAVLLPVTDPADDTPYWLVGTRWPERLAGALARSPEEVR